MSYILDALRKSDQQRQRGTTPTLQTSPSIVAVAEPRRTWLYPVLALILAGVAFAIGTIAPWRKAQDVAVPAVVAPAPAIVAPAPAPATTGPMVATPSPAPAALVAPAPAPALRPPDTIAAQQPHSSLPSTTDNAAPRAASAERSTAPAPVAQQAQALAPVHARAEPPRVPQRASESQAPGRDTKPASEKVQTLAELPASLRAELPSMTVTVHAYSATPKDRLVGVNDKLLREGDSLAPDLVLERITPDGMIFTYKGTRFQRALR
ncbi:MAG TPA: general secretion pathway protein GspB [Burkholderiales bacterium]|nr:general secretion pathway protein GspB [Burkholderiales bacterium]